MHHLLFALVATICPAHQGCYDAVYDVYDTKQQCEKVVFEERIFNGNCYEVEAIRRNKSEE